MSAIKDINLAPSGAHKIDWVRKNCPLLRSLEDDFSKERPFEGIRIALSIHLEAKTAYLCKVLAAGGAEMYITGSNPLSTQDDVAAALVADGLNVYAWYDCTPEEYDQHITSVLENNCNIIIMTAVIWCICFIQRCRINCSMSSEVVRRQQPVSSA